MNNLHKWTEKWLLLFHRDKCKIMRLGNKPIPNYFYLPSSHNPLEIVHEERDLGVLFYDRLSFNQHINGQVNKANRVMGAIRRSFTDLNKHNFKTLFMKMVRPHLEYAAPIWNPYLKKNITVIENVQRRATKLVPGLSKYPYPITLERTDLPKLRLHRQRRFDRGL